MKYTAMAMLLKLEIPAEELLIRKFFALKQREDEEVRNLIDQVEKQSASEPFELHNDILIIRDTVLSPDADFGIWRQNLRLVVSRDLARELILCMHEDFGHIGINQTLARCRDIIYFRKLGQLTRSVLACCEPCKLLKGRGEEQVHTGFIKMPLRPFHRVGVDLYGPLRRTKSTQAADGRQVEDAELTDDIEVLTKPWILTVCDFKTGYTKFRFIPDGRSKTVATHFHAILLELGVHNVVQEIVSDNGAQFTSKDFEALRQRYPGLRHHRIPVASPKHGGFYEIRHRDCKAVIAKELVARPFADWIELAAMAEFKVNSNRDEAGYPSPFALIFGFEPPARIDKLRDILLFNEQKKEQGEMDAEPLPKRPRKIDKLKYFEELKNRLDQFERLCEDKFRESRLDGALQRKLSRRPELQPGTQVLVRARRKVKHDPRWHNEPFIIKEVFKSMVVAVGPDGVAKTFALSDVKKDDQLNDDLDSDFDDLDARSEIDLDDDDDLDNTLPTREGDREDQLAADSDCSVQSDKLMQITGRRNRKPTWKQLQNIQIAESKAKERSERKRRNAERRGCI